MGGHYGSILVRTEDATVVQAALEQLAREVEARFLLSPPSSGWVAVFPHEHGHELTISEALAERISAPLLHCVVHDDDVFLYHFYEGGKLIDSYNSCPDYFGGEPAPRGGKVETLRSLLPDPAQRAQLKELLDREDIGFEVERLTMFAHLIGLPNAVGAYEYLQDGERDGIKQWKKFVHVPDLTPERTAKRTAKARVKVEMQRLASEGLLLKESVGAKATDPQFHRSPKWGVNPAANTVLLAWADVNVNGSGRAPLFRIDARTGQEEFTGMEVSDRAYCMSVSPSGRWLAIGFASGDWLTQLWDLETESMAGEFPQSRMVSAVRFSRDERKLFSLSEDTITVIEVANATTVGTIKLPASGRTLAVHPSGEFLAAEFGGMLAVVHLPTRTVTKVHWIMDQPGPKRTLVEQIRAKSPDQMPSEVNQDIPAIERERLRSESVRRLLPKQGLFSLEFNPDGKLLICGTGAGVCVLDWCDVLNGDDRAPLTAKLFAAGEPQELDEDGCGTGNMVTYAVPFDAVQQRVLFAGLEGKVRYFDLATGRTGDLLVPPLRRPFWHLELTPDRSALVGTAVHLTRQKKDPPKFQIWSYPALCQAAGLAW